MSSLVPQDHAEAIAPFRSEIVGALPRRELDRGDLSQALAELSQQRFRPPRAKSTKTYSVATLERWSTPINQAELRPFTRPPGPISSWAHGRFLRRQALAAVPHRGRS